MLCMGMTEEDIASSTARDRAIEATEGNQSIGEYLQLLSSDLRPPPRTYAQLCKMIATYAALNWDIGGENNDHYKKVKEMRDILEHPSVVAREYQFTPLMCRQYTWGVHVDNREFYKERFHPSQFAVGVLKFKESQLDGVIDAVKRAAPYEDGSFPDAWKEPSDRAQGKQVPQQKQPAQQGKQQPQQQQWQPLPQYWPVPPQLNHALSLSLILHRADSPLQNNQTTSATSIHG